MMLFNRAIAFAKFAGSDLSIWQKLIDCEVKHISFGIGLIDEIDSIDNLIYITVTFINIFEVDKKKRFHEFSFLNGEFEEIDIDHSLLPGYYEYYNKLLTQKNNHSTPFEKQQQKERKHNRCDKNKNVRYKVERKALQKEEEIITVINQRKINYLVHFTRAENLASILSNGLVPVSMHGKLRINTMINDVQRYDEYVNATSCSVEFPNYKLFYYFRNLYESSDWIIIKIKSDILISLDNKAHYCLTNAASLSNRMIGSSVESFKNMFAENISKCGIIINRVDLSIPPMFTTDPQAEILIEGIINQNYFHSICFNSKRVLDSYEKDIKDIAKEIGLKIEPRFFAPRQDWDYW